MTLSDQALQEAEHEAALLGVTVDYILTSKEYEAAAEQAREIKIRRLAQRLVDLGEGRLATGASWEPRPATEVAKAIQAGLIERTYPTVGRLHGGMALLYRGKINGIHGASGSGKSWSALVMCLQELEDDESVIYVDFEDDEASVVARLLDMGATEEELARFYYIQPEEPYAEDFLIPWVKKIGPSLVVIDSTGEAMSAESVNPNADEEVARWFKGLPAAIAKTGAAVLLLDHMSKADGSGLWPIGSQRKRAAISGAQYLQTTVTPFDKTTPGTAELRCAKDRHGNYRINHPVATLAVDPEGEGRLQIDLVAHGFIDETPSEKLGRMMERVSRFLEALPPDHNGAGVNMIKKREHVKGNNELKIKALERLVRDGYAETEAVGQSILHRSLQPYRFAPGVVVFDVDEADGEPE